MNAAFERFIRVALREAPRLDAHAFPPAARGHPVHLDVHGAIRLQPDLSLWTGDRCVFAGDCKYKKADDTMPNADVYQMLAYLTALQLTHGLLANLIRSVTAYALAPAATGGSLPSCGGPNAAAYARRPMANPSTGRGRTADNKYGKAGIPSGVSGGQPQTDNGLPLGQMVQLWTASRSGGFPRWSAQIGGYFSRAAGQG